MMKVKNWHIIFTANLIDGSEYSKSFYSDMELNHATLDEVIAWVKNFKENIVIVKKE